MDRKARNQARYQARKLAGLCTSCSAGLDADDVQKCVECAAMAAASARRYQSSDRGRETTRKRVAALRRRRVDAGICVRCSVPATPGRRMCVEHAKEHSIVVQLSKERSQEPR